MSISQQYTLDGPTDFTFPFPVRTADQLVVSVSPGGVVPSSSYEVIGASATATSVTVRYPDAPIDGTKVLVIARQTEPQRVSTFLNDLSITATALNAEFDNLLQLIQDGILSTFTGDWETGKAYTLLEVVRYAPNGNIYIARESHTAGDFDTDLADGKWDLVADFETGQINIDNALAAAEAARDAAQAAEADAEAAEIAAELSAANALQSEQNAAPVNAIVSEIQTVAAIDTSVDVVASDLAGAGFDYDLGSITQAASGVVGTPDGYIITVFNIRDEIVAVSDNETNINTVGTIATDVSTVAGISGDVTTVAGISTDITTVAADGTDIGVVAGISSDVTTVAGISSDVTIVAADTTDIGTVSANITDVSTVAGASTDVTTVAGISGDVTAVAGNATNINTVAGISGDVTTVAGVSADVSTVAGISSDVTTVAGDTVDIGTVAGISAAVGTVAGISSDVTAVSGISSDVTAVSGISGDVSAVANVTSDVTLVADNITDVTNFADVYYPAAAFDPATRPDGDPSLAGDLYFNTTLDALKVYNGSAWQVAASSAEAVVYDNTTSGLTAVDVQDAIDEVVDETAKLAGGNTFTGNQAITGNVTITGTVDCGTLA